MIYFILRCQSCWCCQLRQPKSVEDYKKSVDNAVSESKADKTKWVCTLFEEWKQNRLVRSCAFEIRRPFYHKRLWRRSTNLGHRSLQICNKKKETLLGNGILPQPSRSLYSQYLRTEAPLFWRKRTCCIETFGHVRPKVSYIFGGINRVAGYSAVAPTFRRVVDAEMKEATRMGLTWIFIDLMQVVNVHILVEYATLTGERNTAFHWVSKRVLGCGIHPVIGSWPYWVWDSSSKIVHESFFLQ